MKHVRFRLKRPQASFENVVLTLALAALVAGRFGPGWLANLLIGLLIAYLIGMVLFYTAVILLTRHRRAQSGAQYDSPTADERAARDGDNADE